MRASAQRIASARVSAMPAMISVSRVSRPERPSVVCMSTRVHSPSSHARASASLSETCRWHRGPWPSRSTVFSGVNSTSLISRSVLARSAGELLHRRLVVVLERLHRPARSRRARPRRAAPGPTGLPARSPDRHRIAAARPAGPRRPGNAPWPQRRSRVQSRPAQSGPSGLLSAQDLEGNSRSLLPGHPFSRCPSAASRNGISGTRTNLDLPPCLTRTYGYRGERNGDRQNGAVDAEPRDRRRVQHEVEGPPRTAAVPLPASRTVLRPGQPCLSACGVMVAVSSMPVSRIAVKRRSMRIGRSASFHFPDVLLRGPQPIGELSLAQP